MGARIQVVGLGPGPIDLLSVGALEVMESVPVVYLRTREHPAVAVLERRGVRFRSLDHLYDAPCIAGRADEAVARLLRGLARGGEQVVYAVPGYPGAVDGSARFILEVAEAAGIEVDLVPASGFLLEPLLGIVRRLRGEGGCPWDRQQSHASLKPYVIEEAYEVAEAIDGGSVHKLCSELGDLLLQIALHAEIAREAGEFDLGDVVAAVMEKMTRRHPHVFGGARVETSEEVLRRWDRIKAAESGRDAHALGEAAGGGPALMRACRVQSAAARLGFDWARPREVIAKIAEEITEFTESLDMADRRRIEDEIGDLLFSVVNIARFLGIEPETALSKAVNKFVRRFRFMEEKAREQGREITQMNMKEMDELWERAKGELPSEEA